MKADERKLQEQNKAEKRQVQGLQEDVREDAAFGRRPSREMDIRRQPTREIEIRYGDIGEEEVEDEPVDQTGAGDMPGGPDEGDELPPELHRKLEKKVKAAEEKKLDIERERDGGYGAMSPSPEEVEPDER